MVTEGIIDASTIVSLVVPEEYSEWASAAVSRYSYLRTLELACHEVTNAICSKVLKKELSEEDASKALKDALELIDSMETHIARHLITESFNIALEADISAYDASYIALAKKQHSKLITLDKKLAKKLNGTTYSSFLEYPK